MIIGITGSVGSGKTAVAKLFSRHWYSRIDADKIGHNLIKKSSKAYNGVIKEFGKEVADKNGNIDRKKLGNIVFNDPKKLKKLNLIMHPLIIIEIKNKIRQIQKKCGNKAKIIIDAPLLLETKAKDLVDKVIVVKCDKKNIFKRNKRFTKRQIERILKHQTPLMKKLKYADFVIDNNKSLKRLEKQVENTIRVMENENSSLSRSL